MDNAILLGMQHQKQNEAAANQIMIGTAQAIFAQLVAKIPPDQVTPAALRACAANAKAAAPYLAEAFGLVKVNTEVTDA